MKKLIYTRLDGGVSVVIPAPKKGIEDVLGPLTVAEYEAHVLERSIPVDAINIRSIDDTDFPASGEFRNAWEDSQPGTQVDISCEKARDIKLEQMRMERVNLFEAQDKLSIVAMENGDDMTVIKAEKTRLRDITNPLKALGLSGKFNDKTLLKQISELSEIQV